MKIFIFHCNLKECNFPMESAAALITAYIINNILTRFTFKQATQSWNTLRSAFSREKRLMAVICETCSASLCETAGPAGAVDTT